MDLLLATVRHVKLFCSESAADVFQVLTLYRLVTSHATREIVVGKRVHIVNTCLTLPTSSFFTFEEFGIYFLELNIKVKPFFLSICFLDALFSSSTLLILQSSVPWSGVAYSNNKL